MLAVKQVQSPRNQTKESGIPHTYIFHNALEIKTAGFGRLAETISEAPGKVRDSDERK